MSPFTFLFPIAKFGRFYHVFIFGMQRFYIVPATSNSSSHLRGLDFLTNQPLLH